MRVGWQANPIIRKINGNTRTKWDLRSADLVGTALDTAVEAACRCESLEHLCMPLSLPISHLLSIFMSQDNKVSPPVYLRDCGRY